MATIPYNLFTRVELLCAHLYAQVERPRQQRALPEEKSVDQSNQETSTARSLTIATTASQEASVAAEDQGNALMARLQAGDPTALPAMYRLYNGRLYSFILRMVHDRETAEDIVQEAWLSVYQSRDRYESTYRFSTWLFTIARRKALSEIRRRKVRSIVRSLRVSRPGEEETTLEVPQDTFRQPDADASGSVLATYIEQALDRLSVNHREIIMLRDVEGLENEEVAEILGWNVKPGALRKRIFDARSAFRREMERLGVNGYEER